MCATRLSRIDDVMQEKTENGDFSGISTLVARRGKIVHFKQFGYRDREDKSPMQQDTLFRMYSMTKPIICTALMTLYEQGKFDLQDPIEKYIPSFAQLKVLDTDENGKETLVDIKSSVTISHLLTHTSGLVYDFYEDSPICEMYRKHHLNAHARTTSLEEFVKKLSQLPLAFQPGSKWYYSVSIDVLGHLIEVISGKSLADFLNEIIFEPLSMTDTGFTYLKKNTIVLLQCTVALTCSAKMLVGQH